MKVGVTGHQDLGSVETVTWVIEAMSQILLSIDAQEGFTSLAKGADQLFAKTLLQLKIPYTAILPCRNIERSFSSQVDLEQFRVLLATAASRITLPFEDPSEEAYFKAGQSIVDRATLVIAIWDGLPAKGIGGTADIVQYARKEELVVFQLNPIVHSVSRLE